MVAGDRAYRRCDGGSLSYWTETALTTYSRDLQRDSDLTAAQARAREAEQQAKRLYVGGKLLALGGGWE